MDFPQDLPPGHHQGKIQILVASLGASRWQYVNRIVIPSSLIDFKDHLLAFAPHPQDIVLLSRV